MAKNFRGCKFLQKFNLSLLLIFRILAVSGHAAFGEFKSSWFLFSCFHHEREKRENLHHVKFPAIRYILYSGKFSWDEIFANCVNIGLTGQKKFSSTLWH